MKLSEAMRERMLLSFELFPPKTEKGMDNLPGTIDHLMKYKPAYISCTYGAGGGNVGANREVCQMIRKAGTIPVAHFTVIKNTKEGIKEQLDQYLAEGVDHMLALRGDIPLGETTTCGDFNYATDLVKFVRDEFGDKFEIAVAGSPEGHIACRNMYHLKLLLWISQSPQAFLCMLQAVLFCKLRSLLNISNRFLIIHNLNHHLSIVFRP